MRIALFSDVHANLPAMEACLRSMEAQQPDAIYCLGDLVGYNVWPNEVVNLVRSKGIPAIAGNYDQGIGLGNGECGCAYKTATDQEHGKISISYTDAVIGAAERQYLRTLPAHIRISFQLNHELLQLLLVHGSPRKINEYLFEDREEKSLLRILQDADADVLCFGHTHKPFHRVLQDSQTGRLRHAINIGSVGKPKDGNPQGCYAIIELQEGSTSAVASSIQVSFVRFDYDVEKAAQAVEQSPLPDVYADMLRKAY